MVSVIKFSEFNDGGDLANDDVTVGFGGGDNIFWNNPWTFLPPGTTGDRPVPAADNYYRLRLNTTLQVYEYYDPISALWTELSGSGTGTVNPGTTNDIAYYPFNGTTLSPVTHAANAVLVTNGGDTPSLSTTLPTGLSIPGATITTSTASLTSGQVAAVPTVPTDIANKAYVDAQVAGDVTSITGTTNQVIASSPTGAVTLSLPQDIATTSTPRFAGFNDSANLAILRFTTTATSVNYIDIKNNATGFGPYIIAQGSDPNVNLNLSGSGTGYPVLIGANTAIGYSVLSGTTNQHITNFDFADTANTRTVTWPDSDGTVAFVGTTIASIQGTANQVLVNGTSGSPQVGAVILTTPQDINTTADVRFNSIRLNSFDAVYDSNNNKVFYFNNAALAVNYIRVNTNATGGDVGFQAVGTDPNIGMVLQSKGTGIFGFYSESTTTPIVFATGTSYQHMTEFNFANTAVSRTITWDDNDGTPCILNSAAHASTNGFIPIGNGAGTFTSAALTAGTGIAISNGAGSITISNTTGGLTWTTTSSVGFTAAANNGYVCTALGGTFVTLPATCAVGDVVAVEYFNAIGAGYSIVANTGQTIKIGSATTTSGGSLSSNSVTDNVYVTCIEANTTWRVRSTNSAGLTIG